MRVAQGQRQSDGTYLYTCGTCGGKASADSNVSCDWCYGGDVKRIAAELKTARGARYYALLKAFLVVNGKAMVDEIKRFKAQRDDGKFTPVEMGYVSLKYDLNFKATWDWIHENGLVRYAHDDVSRGFKVKEVYAAVRERYPELGL